tara:strand:- start:486 stop:1193 length:708 start_codon:yes stop_codon:yes gene_type:complete
MIVKKKNNIDIVIMAGGLGRRLKSFTKFLPKPLLPIKDKTLIERVIESFTKYGAKNFIISIHYKARKIKSFFKKLKPKYNYKFIEEKRPLGNVGSLSLLNNTRSKDYIITNGDTIVNFNYKNSYLFHKKNRNDVTLIVSKSKYKIPWGECLLDKDGFLESIKEKPFQYSLANTGIYIINNRLFNLIKKNKFMNFADFILILKKANKKIGIYPINDDDWIDIGEWSSYKKALRKFK